MCFGGGGNPGTPAPVPISAPPPSPTASFSAEETTQRNAQDRRRRIAALRYGMTSTMKTGGEGVTTQPNLLLPAVIGAKTKLGQ